MTILDSVTTATEAAITVGAVRLVTRARPDLLPDADDRRKAFLPSADVHHGALGAK